MGRARRVAALYAAFSQLASGLAVSGEFSAEARGTTGAQFLELPVGARAAAMGNAQGAVVGDASALHYNPARLASIRGGSLMVAHAAYFQEMDYQYGAIAQRLPPLGTLAFGVQTFSAGTLAEVDNLGRATGQSLRPNDLAVSAGLGRACGRWELGAGLRFISSTIRSSASTLALDLGAGAALGRLSLAGSLLHLGPGLKFRRERDRLPTTLRLAAGYAARGWLLATDVVLPRGAAPVAAAGLERALPLTGASSAFLLAGYNSRLAPGGLGGATGWSLGAGYGGGRLRIDYAWVPFGNLGTTHRFSFALGWGKERSRESR